VDNRAVETRDDVLVYTGPVLDEPVEITGPIRATIHMSTDVRDTDITVKLLDVYPDGRALNLSHGIARASFRTGYDRMEPIEPGEVYAIDVEMFPGSNVFEAGHRMRIEVSSSTVSGSGRGVYSSRDSFVDTVSKLLHGAVTVHHGHTEEIELTGADSASGLWAMEDRIWFPEGSPVRTLWGAGWYEEEYERVDGRWRIKRMVLRRQRLEIDGNPVD